MKKCNLCPRGCNSPRDGSGVGFCGETNVATVSRATLHMWEEPSISGTRGAGAIFFCGCNLGCIYCQNKLISRGGGNRKEISAEALSELMLSLQAKGAHNIDLVTPSHFSHVIKEALMNIRDHLHIPVIYNTSAYDSTETLRSLEGLIDVYLPDFKYNTSELASLYSSAPDYPDVAKKALLEMFRQVGECRFDADGMLRRGIVVRHLVLPGHRKESISLLRDLAALLPTKDILLSLMSQYTPEFALDTPHKNLHRRLTRFEYDSVLEVASELDFEGYFQNLSSSSSSFTPDFTVSDL